MYTITKYSYDKAKQFGVKIKPSTRKGKKIDVFDKKDQFITAIGALGYKDYPTFLLEKGKAYADERRRLYKIRHENDNGLAGYYARRLLW
jgi:hypothetical protein